MAKNKAELIEEAHGLGLDGVDDTWKVSEIEEAIAEEQATRAAGLVDTEVGNTRGKPQLGDPDFVWRDPPRRTRPAEPAWARGNLAEVPAAGPNRFATPEDGRPEKAKASVGRRRSRGDDE